MNARRGIVSGLIIAAAVSVLPAGGPIAAQAMGGSSTKVNKVVVKFSDLNLHEEKGVKKLLGRIKRAAVRVCGGNSGTPRAYAYRTRPSYRRCVENSNQRALKTLTANLNNRAGIALRENDLDKADDLHRRALTLNEVLERKEDMIVHLRELSEIAIRRGQFEVAGTWRARALALNRELGRTETALADLDRMGWIARKRGDLKAAQDHYREALALSAQLGRDEDMARHIRHLGLVAAKGGDFQSAEALHRSSLALHRSAGRKEGVALSLADLGALARSRGDIEAAKELHHHALSLNSELGRKEQMAVQHGNLWPLALEQNRLDEAEVHLQQAVRLAREAGVLNETPALGEVQMGLIRLARGRTSEACAAWNRAQDIYRQLGKADEIDHVHEMMRDSRCPAGQDPSVTAALQ